LGGFGLGKKRGVGGLLNAKTIDAPLFLSSDDQTRSGVGADFISQLPTGQPAYEI